MNFIFRILKYNHLLVYFKLLSQNYIVLSALQGYDFELSSEKRKYVMSSVFNVLSNKIKWLTCFFTMGSSIKQLWSVSDCRQIHMESDLLFMQHHIFLKAEGTFLEKTLVINQIDNVEILMFLDTRASI